MKGNSNGLYGENELLDEINKILHDHIHTIINIQHNIEAVIKSLNIISPSINKEIPEEDIIRVLRSPTKKLKRTLEKIMKLININLNPYFFSENGKKELEELSKLSNNIRILKTFENIHPIGTAVWVIREVAIESYNIKSHIETKAINKLLKNARISSIELIRICNLINLLKTYESIIMKGQQIKLLNEYVSSRIRIREKKPFTI